MALDRRSLSNTPGLLFWKLLGTGSGRSFSVRDADPSTWGLFAVWENLDALQEFSERSHYARIWKSCTDEQWMAQLRPTRCRGTWAGKKPFGEIALPEIGLPEIALPETTLPEIGLPDSTALAGQATVNDSPRIAVVTRARVRPSKWRSFAAAVPSVAMAVNAAPGMQYTVGIGEAPIGLQATFSLWESEASMMAFAYSNEHHREVVRTTVTNNWYAEEMFARFRVESTTGTLNGVAL
jgi:quinol monooxygenase YgiN